MPSLIRAVEADLDAGRSAVIQLVSTGEALMERRIAEIPASEWDGLNIHLTPRDGILSFLMHAFPVQLQEPFTDDDGNLMSRPAVDAEGNPIICREAEAQRDALIEKLAALSPVPTALDQIVQRFGHEAVVEVTGRSRRVLRITDARSTSSPPRHLEDFRPPDRRSRPTGFRPLAVPVSLPGLPAVPPSSRLSRAPSGAVRNCSSAFGAILALRDVRVERTQAAPSWC